MSDMEMSTERVIGASRRLREGDGELRPQLKLERAHTAVQQVPGSATGQQWPGTSTAVASAFERFRQANAAIEQKLVASAHAYEQHEHVNAASISSVEA